LKEKKRAKTIFTNANVKKMILPPSSPSLLRGRAGVGGKINNELVLVNESFGFSFSLQPSA
jgi:hypothetical protein